MVDHTATLKKIITVYGQQAQVDMIIEECAEVIQALQKYKRAIANHAGEDIQLQNRLDNVHEELADLSIMVEQGRLIFDPERIDEWIEFKIKRVKNKLAAY